jgi:chaperonin GroEL (HSP60 family)
LEDAVENVGVKLVRQAGAKTNDLAGDGSTTAVILAHGLITEGVKVWNNECDIPNHILSTELKDIEYLL